MLNLLDWNMWILILNDFNVSLFYYLLDWICCSCVPIYYLIGYILVMCSQTDLRSITAAVSLFYCMYYLYFPSL